MLQGCFQSARLEQYTSVLCGAQAFEVQLLACKTQQYECLELGPGFQVHKPLFWSSPDEKAGWKTAGKKGNTAIAGERWTAWHVTHRVKKGPPFVRVGSNVIRQLGEAGQCTGGPTQLAPGPSTQPIGSLRLGNRLLRDAHSA